MGDKNKLWIDELRESREFLHKIKRDLEIQSEAFETLGFNKLCEGFDRLSRLVDHAESHIEEATKMILGNYVI